MPGSQALNQREQSGNLAPKFSKICLGFWYNNNYNHFAPQKNQLVAALQIVKVEVYVREVCTRH